MLVTRRPRYPMPEYFRKALLYYGLMEAYRARPPYQRNDYIGWIKNAKRPATKQKRLEQMIKELQSGKRYMKMPYSPTNQ